MLYAIIGGIIGAVGGYLLKHVQDTAIINELSESLIDEAKANDRLQADNKRLAAFASRKMVEAADPDVIFYDMSAPLPDEPKIDFGGIEI